jgi:3-hydroxybutyryl-CoA dehydrogenase
MGAGIAQVALEAGETVRLHDVDPAAVVRSRVRIAAGLSRRASKRGLDPDAAAAEVAATLERLVATATLAELAQDADLVIEAALEDLPLKRDIFRTLDEVAPAGAILATNTSALAVRDVASGTRHPERVVGLHFFNPAAVMRLVEVVAAPGSDQATVAQAAAFVARWGKTPVVCADSPGFIVNRVNRPFTIEALRLLETGAGTVPEIDGAIRAAGFPMGPFELMDLIGIDVNLAAARGVYEGFGRAERFRPSPIQERLVSRGDLGRKTGRGFYRYDDAGGMGGPSAVEEDARTHPGERGEAARIVERIVLAIVNEAFIALGEDLAGADDIDLAMRLGAGHPVGPIERVGSLGGRAAVVGRLATLAAELGSRFDPAPALLDLR